ncbi:hypothetical protein RclHR1_23190004 [Rhizophagus clarus]|uniref:Reverse transcriptase domain-containing protein n=1 Tax=Rhizophagus clarus TaxID=94130 RepID=A0A2Z6QVA9_9GLOM|nr:hypothetical protein RclHR1_23190004 [Rhizophagus clarus]
MDTNRHRIQDTLDIARNFYKLVDIKINHKKCNLIVINLSFPSLLLTVSLEIHNSDNITPVKTEAHYLGIWILSKNTRSLTKQHIIRTRNEFLMIVKHKKLSLSQLIYLINKVLYLKIIYLSQLSHFTKPEWNVIERLILAVIKHAIEIQRSFSTAVLYHEGFVGLHSLWMQVSISGIMNLYNTLNSNNGAMGSTLIRLWQAQLMMKIQDCCFRVDQHYQNLYIIASHTNQALFYLILASDFHINFCLDASNTNCFSIINVDQPLVALWKHSYTLSAIIHVALKSNHFPLVDLTQLTSGDRSILMTWKQYRSLADLSRKGPKAKWYKQLKNAVLESLTSRILALEFRSSRYLFHILKFLTPLSRDGQVKEWVVIQ